MCSIPSPQKPGGLAFHRDSLPVLWGKQVEGPVFMSLAPLWFVGLQNFTNPVAVTLDRKEETPFLPLLFSCLFNFHNLFVKGGQYMAAHLTVPAGSHGSGAGVVTFVQQNREERGEERGRCTRRHEHNEARLLSGYLS